MTMLAMCMLAGELIGVSSVLYRDCIRLHQPGSFDWMSVEFPDSQEMSVEFSIHEGQSVLGRFSNYSPCLRLSLILQTTMLVQLVAVLVLAWRKSLVAAGVSLVAVPRDHVGPPSVFHLRGLSVTTLEYQMAVC